MKTTLLSYFSFALLAVTAASLAVLSAGSHAGWSLSLYTSWPMVTLWTLTAVSALAVIFRRHLYRHPATFFIHIAFAVILAGALLTHLTAREGKVHLRVNESAASATEGDLRFPSPVRLDSFRVETYRATGTPRDYVGHVSDARGHRAVVSMNSPGHLSGYTFVSESYDSDGRGITFGVSRDLWGTGVTFAGYILLGISLLLYFFSRGTEWRRALGRLAAGVLLALPVAADAADASAIADEFGSTAVFYNDRICPMSSLARDFTAGLTGGSSSFEGYDADEVLAGFLFDFGKWRQEEIIRIDSPRLREILGGRHVSYETFFSAVASGRIDLEDEATRKEFGKDIDRFEAVNMLVSGELMKIFPVASGDGDVTWLSPTDRLPGGMDNDRWMFVRKFLGLLNEQVQRGDTGTQRELLDALRRYQMKETGGALPSPSRIRAERVYVRAASARWPWMAVTGLGLLLFILTATGFRRKRLLLGAGVAAAALLLCALTAMTAARWVISGHIPLSNGYETMQFLAWVLLLTSLLFRRVPVLVPMGILAAGLALGVSALGGSGSSVTGLMPVLDSRLLSVHVALVMCSYALFFLMALTGLLGLLRKNDCERMAALAEAMLYPALALLAGGIFVGAVWADVSWGRYWGWDPKEVWALITLLVYSFAAHPGLLPRFRRPRCFNAFMALAFICVIITYFGVNFFLGGLHSYA